MFVFTNGKSEYVQNENRFKYMYIMASMLQRTFSILTLVSVIVLYHEEQNAAAQVKYEN